MSFVMQELVSYRENLTKINRVVSFRGFVPDKDGEPHGPNSLSSRSISIALLSPLSLPPPDKAGEPHGPNSLKFR